MTDTASPAHPTYRFGWVPSTDASPRFPSVKTMSRLGRNPIAPAVDMRPAVLAAALFGPTAGGDAILDQGGSSACVAHAGSIAWRTFLFGEALAGRLPNSELDKIDLPSRLAGYQGARRVTGNEHEDEGTQIQAWFDFASRIGLPNEHDPELDLAFDPSRVLENVIDSSYVQRASYDNRHIEGVNRLDDGISGSALEAAIDEALSNHEPVVIGCPLDAQIFSLRPSDVYKRGTGWVGNHAMALFGYDPVRRAYLMGNSWGTGWCDGGFGWLSKDWVLDEARDIHRFRITL